MNILLLGSGGREHAMACQLAASPRCSHLYVAPGNAGTAAMANHYGQTSIQNIDIPPTDFKAIHACVLKYGIEMVVVGPEAPFRRNPCSLSRRQRQSPKRRSRSR